MWWGTAADTARHDEEEAYTSAVQRSHTEALRERRERREQADQAMAQAIHQEELSTANDADMARNMAAAFCVPRPVCADPQPAPSFTRGQCSGNGAFGSSAHSSASPFGALFGGSRNGGTNSLQPPPIELRSEDMIHVACEIGDTAVEMLVDTGAQTSIITAQLVQTLRLSTPIDSSHRGVASGVGKANILGRLHAVPVKLGHVECHIDFSVLELDKPLLLLGLDQLKRFKVIIDLERDVLVFGGVGGVEVPFLKPSRPTSRSELLPELGCAQQ